MKRNRIIKGPLPPYRAFALSLLLGLLAAACSVTRVVTPVSVNPLKQVAEKAANEYSVTWVDESTLLLSDAWPVRSVLSIGYSAFHADLHYSNGHLFGQFYLRDNGLLSSLFLPQYIDSEPGFYGAVLKGYIAKQMREVLGWANSSAAMEGVSTGPPIDVRQLAAGYFAADK